MFFEKCVRYYMQFLFFSSSNEKKKKRERSHPTHDNRKIEKEKGRFHLWPLLFQSLSQLQDGNTFFAFDNILSKRLYKLFFFFV